MMLVWRYIDCDKTWVEIVGKDEKIFSFVNESSLTIAVYLWLTSIVLFRLYIYFVRNSPEREVMLRKVRCFSWNDLRNFWNTYYRYDIWNIRIRFNMEMCEVEEERYGLWNMWLRFRATCFGELLFACVYFGTGNSSVYRRVCVCDDYKDEMICYSRSLRLRFCGFAKFSLTGIIWGVPSEFLTGFLLVGPVPGGRSLGKSSRGHWPVEESELEGRGEGAKRPGICVAEIFGRLRRGPRMREPVLSYLHERNGLITK